jgi:hypothetical protein
MHGGISDAIYQSRRIGGAFVAAVMLLSFAAESRAQLLKGRLRQQEPEIEAIAGEPYGVGRWTVPLPAGVNPALLGNNGFTLTEKNGRANFQAFQAEPLRSGVRELLGRPQMVTVYFLFTGNQPLELQLFSPTATATSVTPRREPIGHERLMEEWWVRYTRQTNRIDRPADYPQLVDNYLLATLSRRLNLPAASQLPPPPIRMIATNLLGSALGGATSGTTNAINRQSGDEQFDRQLGLLFGSDGLRGEMQAKVLDRRNEPIEPADQPLPPPLTFNPPVPEALGQVAIEPIAQHVPAECFYVRFGNFPNYLWFHNTLDRWSGDFQNLTNRRGLDFGISERVERQISLKQSILAPLLGPAVIADVAMIGGDFFFREGPTIGMLFEARNAIGLNSDITRQRDATLKREAGCTMVDVDIAGHNVSFLSTPDNRVRSFYAIDGDYYLVTNSRRLVERFYEAGAGKDALGGAAEFRFARSQMPGKGDYTVFAYLSAKFFQNLVGAQYQIEMDRRLRSAAEMDMALVAQVAARSEGVNARTIDELIKSQYLPEGFGQRVDGSHLELSDSGEFVDSLRGGRGSFLPILDVPLTHVTATESRSNQDFAAWLQAKWGQIDPVVAGIRREPSHLKEPGVEHIVLDVQLTPMAAKNYETIANALGPISKQRVAPMPGDMVSGDAILSGNLLASKGLAAPQGAYRLFGALRDAPPEGLGANAAPQNTAPPTTPAVGRGGLMQIGNALLAGASNGQSPSLFSMLPPFYFGAYPTPALFSWLGVDIVPPDASGYSRTSSGLWERKNGKFTVAAPQREILEAVTPQLRLVDVARPAQAWLHCGDVSHSKLIGLINGIFYRTAKNAGVGNVRFLQELSTQLHVPPEECLKTAEQLTDAKLVCPVGGTYQLNQNSGTVPTWTSTALPSDRMRLIDGLLEPAPAAFTAPLLTWLRGLDADVALDQRTLSLHAEVEMQQNSGTSAAAKAPSTPAIPGLPSLTFPSTSPPPRPTPPQPANSKNSKAEDLPPPKPQPAR